jgi:hydroxymethylglutaryl-CoA reductase (NADPH)
MAGPLKIRGEAAQGSFYIPLATTEGTLVLAVTRGALAINEAGGVETAATETRVTRAPLFVFSSHRFASAAGCWITRNLEKIRELAEATTRHGRLASLEPVLYGRRLVLVFSYSTGDASGQNMVTFATDTACRWLRKHAPFNEAEFYALESNVSHDKKIAALCTPRQRGRRVDADVTVPRPVVSSVLKTTPEAMARVAREGIYSCTLSGAIGAQAQFANVLTSLFVATGQDAAAVTECGTGLTLMEVTASGDLYASVTIPSLLVATVGGGTRLPSQRECLELLDCYGMGRARKLAEIAGAAVLAGELALVAALASDTFAIAHRTYGRPV